MTGIDNKAGKTGCNHCRNPKHWLENCPHWHVAGADLEVLRKKHTAAPQLLHFGEGKNRGDESDNDPSLGDLEGVALMLSAAGIIVRMSKRKLYFDSCASDIQTFWRNGWRILMRPKLGYIPSAIGGITPPPKVEHFRGPSRPGWCALGWPTYYPSQS